MNKLKAILKNLSLITLLFSFNISNAQIAYPSNYSSVQAKSSNKITSSIVSFTVKYIDNKVCLNWVVRGLKEDCIYFIQRLENDLDFVK